MKLKDVVDVPKIHFNFSDLLVDFFGCLIPGFVFLMFIGILFYPPIAFIDYLSKDSIFSTLLKIESFQPLLLVFVFIFSYIFGHLFYRLDPKNPDKESYWFIRDKLKNSGPFREYFNGECFCCDCSKKKDDICTDLSNCEKSFIPKGEIKNIRNNGFEPKIYKTNLDVEYPYNYLTDYLVERGFDSLARLIPWDSKDFKKRTKHFINTLKIRISINAPNNYSQIARNEAHIRLMSSVWYMLKILQKACVISISFIAIILVTQHDSYQIIEDFKNNGLFSVLLLLPIVLFAVFWYMIRNIKKFYHYQRIREIVYVLETAEFLHSNDIKIFKESEISKSN